MSLVAAAPTSIRKPSKSPSSPSSTALGQAIRAVRKERLDHRNQRMTQQTLAFAAGLTTASIVRIEGGRGNPRWSSLIAVCRALDTSLFELICRAEWETARRAETPDRSSAGRRPADRPEPVEEVREVDFALAGAIRQARKDIGLTCEQLAARAGIHPRAVTAMERGQVNEDSPAFAQVCKALDITIDELVEEYMSLPAFAGS